MKNGEVGKYQIWIGKRNGPRNENLAVYYPLLPHFEVKKCDLHSISVPTPVYMNAVEMEDAHVRTFLPDVADGVLLGDHRNAWKETQKSYPRIRRHEILRVPEVHPYGKHLRCSIGLLEKGAKSQVRRKAISLCLSKI